MIFDTAESFYNKRYPVARNSGLDGIHKVRAHVTGVSNQKHRSIVFGVTFCENAYKGIEGSNISLI